MLSWRAGAKRPTGYACGPLTDAHTLGGNCAESIPLIEHIGGNSSVRWGANPGEARFLSPGWVCRLGGVGFVC